MNFIIAYIQKFINLKFGLIGAFLMGGIVFIINLEHGWQLSAIAGLKQWMYTFLFGGVIIRLLEYLLSITKSWKRNRLFSVAIISTFTSLLVFFVHSLKGTPEPLLSTIPTILMSPPGFLYLATKFEKKH